MQPWGPGWQGGCAMPAGLHVSSAGLHVVSAGLSPQNLAALRRDREPPPLPQGSLSAPLPKSAAKPRGAAEQRSPGHKQPLKTF